MAETSTQVEPKASRKPATKDELDGFRMILAGKPYPVSLDPGATQALIVQRTVEAESFEATLREQNERLPDWPLDEPVVIRSVHLNKSDFYREGDPGTGPSAYAVCDIVTADGELLTVSVGGWNVLAQLYQWLKQGGSDRNVKLIEKQTGQEYTTLWLVPA